jgi:hypothetical protein
MSRIEIHKGQPIYWFDGKTPKRTRIGPDGIPVEEKLTAKPWRPFVKPSGAIIQLDLTCAAADRNIHGANATKRLREKIKKGFLPADECPIVTGRMPSGLRQPDDGDGCPEYISPDGAPLTLSNKPPCKHVLRVAAVREKAHKTKSAEWDKLYKSGDSKIVELLMKREEREARAELAAEGKKR